jgi:hypothetical protein
MKVSSRLHCWTAWLSFLHPHEVDLKPPLWMIPGVEEMDGASLGTRWQHSAESSEMKVNLFFFFLRRDYIEKKTQPAMLTIKWKDR